MVKKHDAAGLVPHDTFLHSVPMLRCQVIHYGWISSMLSKAGKKNYTKPIISASLDVANSTDYHPQSTKTTRQLPISTHSLGAEERKPWAQVRGRESLSSASV
jgi:hypothetical protein